MALFTPTQPAKEMRMLERMTAMVATLGLVALATGCSNKDSNSEPQAEAQTPPAEESTTDPRLKDYLDACHLRMTSPDAKEWKTSWDPHGKIMLGEGPSTVHSTYWARDEDHQKYVDSKAPPLEVSCSSTNEQGEMEIGLTIGTPPNLTEADVPYGPGTYPVIPRSTDSNAPKGVWVAPFLYDQSMFEASGGTLTITRFDSKGMAGSFHVEGTEQIVGKRAIVIDGTFDMPCRGGMSEEKCTAGKAIVE
jgi:hypothetical protein